MPIDYRGLSEDKARKARQFIDEVTAAQGAARVVDLAEIAGSLPS